MAEPFLGEIRMLSFAFPPRGWALCNGQLMPINQNQALFALLGTMYGGNGQTNFALPNLQGRSAMHRSNGYLQGQSGGERSHTLSASELPAHTHTLEAVADLANANAPGLALPAARGRGGPLMYAPPAGNGAGSAMHASSIGATGGSQPHENMQPYLTVNFAIALQGIFPSRS